MKAKYKEHLTSEDARSLVKQSHARQEFLLLCMLDELKEKTEWEQNFIKDITQKVVDNIPLSFRQKAKLEQIWRKTGVY